MSITQEFRDKIEKLTCNGHYRIVPLEVDYLYDICDQIDNKSTETCHMFIDDNFNETEGTGDVWIECDVCGWQMSFEPRMPDFNYCPNCGRKVVY